MPPTAAAIDTPNNRALFIPDLPRDTNKGVIAATTIEVAAESDMSIAATMEVNIKAMSIFLVLVPDTFKVRISNFVSRHVVAIADAVKTPPHKSQITPP